MVADLPRPVAMDMARAAIFERAIEVSFSPEYLDIPTLTDQRRPRCKRITARRFSCGYRFTIEDTDTGERIYDERGRVRVTHAKRRLTVDG